MVHSLVLRSIALNVANTCATGVRAGEQGGRKVSDYATILEDGDGAHAIWG
jgi:hypothetical protein